MAEMRMCPGWTAHIKQLRLRCFGRVQTRANGYIGHVKDGGAGRRNRGGPERMFMGVVKGDMKRVGVAEEDARDKDSRRQMMAPPERRSALLTQSVFSYHLLHFPSYLSGACAAFILYAFFSEWQSVEVFGMC